MEKRKYHMKKVLQIAVLYTDGEALWVNWVDSDFPSRAKKFIEIKNTQVALRRVYEHPCSICGTEPKWAERLKRHFWKKNRA